MKLRFLTIGLLSNLTSLAQAAGPGRLPLQLRDATVYQSVAELRQTASLALAAGPAELRLTGLAPGLLPASFQVEVTGGELLASTLQRVYPKTTASDSAIGAQQKLYRLQAEQEGVGQEREFLLANRALPTDTRQGWTTELQKNAAYYRTRLTELASKREELVRAVAAQQELLARLRQPDRRPVAATGLEALVRVQVAKAGTVQLNIRYVVPGSSWQPRHDVRLREVGKPLEVVNRAVVRNESGLDWNGVRVTLLSADPSVGALRPALQPWALRYSGEALNEGRLDDYAARDKAGADEAAASAEAADDGLADGFGVAEGVSVPSGGAQVVLLGAAEAPATLEYLTVPKLDPGVFLLAKVTGWEKLHLMADSANVYVGGAYLGQTYLNTRAFADTLELALGRDPLVTVNRAKREDYSSKGALGRRTVKLTYDITVKNLHKTAVNLRVLDQIPVAQEEEIKVDYKPDKKAPPVLDAESGRLTWQLTLAPNETRKLPFSFEIDYPKRKSVNLHRNRNTKSPKFR